MGGIQQQNTKTVGQTIPIPLILKMVPRQEYVEHDFQNNILGIEYAITSKQLQYAHIARPLGESYRPN